MRTRRQISAVAAALLLGGCAGQVKHEITVSPKLRELPVHTVCLMDPGFPEKVKRRFPDEYPEMALERQAESGRAILAAVTSALAASLTVDSACQTAPGAKAWADGIIPDLVKGRVPLSVDRLPLAVESVLLLGVMSYGTDNEQTKISLLWLKPWRVGKVEYGHRFLVQAVLVKPQTGEVLFDALLEERETGPVASPEMLERVTRRVGGYLLEAFFPGK